MKQNQENTEMESINQQQYPNRTFTLPLMSKKLNSVEKYINCYKQQNKSQNDMQKNDKNESLLSNNAQRLVFGGKYTPDPQVNLLGQTKCYVKYQPLAQQKTDDRLQQLNKIQMQYQHLKSNINSHKDPYTSKFTIPLHKRRLSRNSQSSMRRIEIPHEQIEKQLKKEILVEDGHRYFADLYMMKKERSRLQEDIQKNRKFTIKDQSLDDKHKEREQFLIEKKTKQAEQKKNKMLKNKGLHWNVYYQMLALNRNQKQRMKGINSAFVSTYGLE